MEGKEEKDGDTNDATKDLGSLESERGPCDWGDQGRLPGRGGLTSAQKGKDGGVDSV